VTDEDAVNPASLDSGPHDLQLRPFAAIEQKDVAFADHRGG